LPAITNYRKPYPGNKRPTKGKKKKNTYLSSEYGYNPYSLRRLKQKDCNFQADLGHIARLCLKKSKTQNKF
jgi:hypothetical protein